jgi:histone deacetylase complex regulatory component SIN3
MCTNKANEYLPERVLTFLNDTQPKDSSPSPYDFAAHTKRESTAISFRDTSGDEQAIDIDNLDDGRRSSLVSARPKTDFASIVQSIRKSAATAQAQAQAQAAAPTTTTPTKTEEQQLPTTPTPSRYASIGTSPMATASTPMLPVVTSKPHTPQGATVAGASSPSTPSASKQQNAKQYIDTIKRSLPNNEYREFQALLRDFKLGNLNLPDLMHLHLKRLFGSTRERHPLLRDFIQFIPKKYCEQFQQMVTEICDAEVALPTKAAAIVGMSI